jgi:oligopeptide transport system substrate-binding protein
MTQSKWTRRGLIAGGSAIVIGGAAAALKNSSGPRMNFSHADARAFVRGNGAEPDTLDPHKASGNWENNIIGDMFIGLMTDGPGGEAVPGTAESYSVSQDGLTYTFKLRDHTWSDGTPVTAHDYVYSFRRIANPKTAAQYVSILYPMKNMQEAAAGRAPPETVGARAIDDRTLELTFRFQVPYIKELLTHYTTFAVPRHVVEKYGDDWTRPSHIVVNGPYLLKEWVPNDHIRLKKNPMFFAADEVTIETVDFAPTQDSSAALKRFRGGEFDVVTDSVPPQQIRWLELYLPHELHLSPYILSQYVCFNVRRKPFDDRRVRLALSLAVDREVMTSKVMRAGEQPAYALIPPGMPGYRGAALTFHNQPMARRVDHARALLADAGYGAANPLVFEFNMAGTTETRIISVALQGMWSAIGVNTRLVPSDSQFHYNLLRKHDFQAAWAGWIADYRDPKNYLTLCQAAAPDLNSGSYYNAQFEELVDRSDHERDPAIRAVELRQAEQILLDDVALAPVFFGVARNLVSPQVRGWKDNNVNVHRTRYVTLDRSIRTA